MTNPDYWNAVVAADRLELAARLAEIAENAPAGLRAHMGAHRSSLATVWDAWDAVDDAAALDAAVEASTEALEALALAPCGTIDAFDAKLAYLIAFAREAPEEQDRLEAVMTAGEAWLREREAAIVATRRAA